MCWLISSTLIRIQTNCFAICSSSSTTSSFAIAFLQIQKKAWGVAKVSFFSKLMFLLQLMHFQQRRLTAFYTCVYLVYQSCTAQFARFFALDGDAFYEVIIMQMFSAWRAVRHPQASKIGTTISDEGQERDDHAYFYYFNRSGNFANMSTNLMGLIFQVSIS